MAKKHKRKTSIVIPKNLLAPVATVLRVQLKRLEHTRKKVESSDPFTDEDRASNNAALDIEAEEQFGHAMTSAVRSQLTRRIIQTRRALARIRIGKYGICEVCGNMIDTDRLMVYPEATRCIKCQNKSPLHK